MRSAPAGVVCRLSIDLRFVERLTRRGGSRRVFNEQLNSPVTGTCARHHLDRQRCDAGIDRSEDQSWNAARRNVRIENFGRGVGSQIEIGATEITYPLGRVLDSRTRMDLDARRFSGVQGSSKGTMGQNAAVFGHPFPYALKHIRNPSVERLGGHADGRCRDHQTADQGDGRQTMEPPRETARHPQSHPVDSEPHSSSNAHCGIGERHAPLPTELRPASRSLRMTQRTTRIFRSDPCRFERCRMWRSARIVGSRGRLSWKPKSGLSLTPTPEELHFEHEQLNACYFRLVRWSLRRLGAL